MVCTPDVKGDDQEGEGEHEQSGLPVGRKRRIWVANFDELLDDASQLCSARRYTSNPTDGRSPASSV